MVNHTFIWFIYGLNIVYILEKNHILLTVSAKDLRGQLCVYEEKPEIIP